MTEVKDYREMYKAQSFVVDTLVARHKEHKELIEALCKKIEEQDHFIKTLLFEFDAATADRRLPRYYLEVRTEDKHPEARVHYGPSQG